MLTEVCVFAFLGQKNPLANLVGRKRKFSFNVRRLGEGPIFETRQPKPKLNL